MEEKKDFYFKGTLNGVEYNDPEKFTEALKKAASAGAVRNLSYEYTSSENKKTDVVEKDKASGSLRKALEDKPRKVCDDTLRRVDTIKNIIQKVADLSDELENCNQSEYSIYRLEETQNIIRSSLEKIKFLISGMCIEDRSEFTEKLLEGMKNLLDEADSDYRDFDYEEAKYRKSLEEDNIYIEQEIKELNKDIEDLENNRAYNYQVMEQSKYKCEAFSCIVDFFRNLEETLQTI